MQSLPRCLHHLVMKTLLTDSWMTPSMSRPMLLNRSYTKSKTMMKIATLMILLKAKRMTTMKTPNPTTSPKNQPKRPVGSIKRRRLPRNR